MCRRTQIFHAARARFRGFYARFFPHLPQKNMKTLVPDILFMPHTGYLCMIYRTVIGILILAAVCIVPVAASALSEDTLFANPAGGMAAVGTGYVTVIYLSPDGTGNPELANVAYAMGNINEIPPEAVSVSTKSGVTYISHRKATSGSIANTAYEPDLSPVPLIPPPFGDKKYLIHTIAIGNDQPALLQNNQDFSLTSSATNYYQDTVPDGRQHEWIDLDWKDRNKDLDLTVYAPDSTLGPYSDVADGKKDGRIFLDVSSRFNVTPGHWFFRVRNSGQDFTDYSLNTYSA